MKPKRADWLQADAKEKLNQEIDILEIVKKLRVAYFASEMALKPRQRKLVGFFDEFKLKTPDEKLEQSMRFLSDPNKEERLSMKGVKGEDYGNLEDLIKKNERDAATVIQAVNRARAEEDPIDAIITDRITNEDARDGMVASRKQAEQVNMNDFIESMSAMHHRLTVTVAKRPGSVTGDLKSPLLDRS